MVENRTTQSPPVDLLDLLEPNLTETYQLPYAKHAAETALSLGETAIRFAQIERIPRYSSERRENDAEHSFMLALVATELAHQYFPHLDTGLVAQFCYVHDLIELETGDVPTFSISPTALTQKEANERAAVPTLAPKLPPYTRSLFLRYEAQKEAEAQYVRQVEKQLPVIVDIIGPGKQIMKEDFGIHTPQQLAANELRLSTRLREQYSDPSLAFLHLVRDQLASRFDTVFSQSDTPSI